VSLIEEALRKQRQETEKNETQNILPDEPSPPPLPEENDGTSNPSPQRWTWHLLAGIAGVSLILVAGILWLLFFGMKIWTTKPEGKLTRPVAAVPATPASTNTQQEIVGTQPPKADSPGKITPTNLPPITPSVTEPSTTVTSSPVPSAAVTSAPTVAAISVAAPAGTTGGDEPKIIIIGRETPVTTTSVPDKLMAVIWPRLSVSGIIGTSSGSRGAAIINGQMLGIGSTIEGVKIIAVDKQGVQLRLGDETRTLTVGGTTE
jgi:cytoskeletal protein RodZ